MEKGQTRRGYLREYSTRVVTSMINYGKGTVKPITREIGSTAVLAGAGAYAFSHMPDFMLSVIEGAKHGRHMYRTGGEIIGGSDGQKAVKNLEEALKIIAVTAKENEGAKEILDDYFNERISLVERLGADYELNETIARETERLFVQLNGMIVEYTAAGDELANKASRGLFRKIDDWFMNKVGDAKAAREGLPQLQEIVREARKFYDGREKHEHTVKELCGYLLGKKEESLEKNKKINSHIVSLITQLDRTYEAETHVFKVDDKINLFKALIGKSREVLAEGEVKNLKENVADYRKGVDNTETEIRKDVSIEPFNDKNWVDYVINPIGVGIAAAVAVKGISKLFMPRPLYDGFTSLTLLPITIPAYIGKKALEGISKLKKQKIKKSDGDEVQ